MLLSGRRAIGFLDICAEMIWGRFLDRISDSIGGFVDGFINGFLAAVPSRRECLPRWGRCLSNDLRIRFTAGMTYYRIGPS
jgi:hypothetical protein